MSDQNSAEILDELEDLNDFHNSSGSEGDSENELDNPLTVIQDPDDSPYDLEKFFSHLSRRLKW